MTTIAHPSLRCPVCDRPADGATRSIGRTNERAPAQPEKITVEPCGHVLPAELGGIWLEEARQAIELFRKEHSEGLGEAQ